jgi:hypothetical protein
MMILRGRSNRLIALKGIISMLIAITLTISVFFSFPVHAASPQQTVEIAGTRVYVNDIFFRTWEYKLQPIMDQQTVMVPARIFLESLGMTVTYNAKTKWITGKSKGKTFQFKQGQKDVRVNQATKKMSVAPKMMRKQLHIPVADTAKLLGYAVKQSADLSKQSWLQKASKSKTLNPNQLPIFYARELNLDGVGEKEVLLAFGLGESMYDEVEQIWVGKVKNGTFTAIKKLPSTISYYNNLNVVRMQGSGMPYIVGEYMGGNYSGFSLYQYRNGKFKTILDDTGVGHGMLTDKNEDGWLDGYGTSIINYSACYYSLWKAYTWKNGKFVYDDTYFDYDIKSERMAMGPAEVVGNYVRYAELTTWYKSSDIKKELLAIYVGGLKTPAKVLQMEVCTQQAMTDFATKVISKTSKKAIIKGGATNRDDRYVEAIFTLEKQNNRWRIVSIK